LKLIIFDGILEVWDLVFITLSTTISCKDLKSLGLITRAKGNTSRQVLRSITNCNFQENTSHEIKYSCSSNVLNCSMYLIFCHAVKHSLQDNDSRTSNSRRLVVVFVVTYSVVPEDSQVKVVRHII